MSTVVKKDYLMFITKLSLPRRTFLRGAGAAVALPLLEAMVPAVTALAKTPGKPQPRFGAIYFPNGAILEQWTPVDHGEGLRVHADVEAARAVPRVDCRGNESHQGGDAGR